MPRVHHAYLHGFASNARSLKGTRLAARFRERDLTLHLPDLNVPSFSRLTYTEALGAIDALVAAEGAAPWRFVGSSMGGYLAARWAELHPDRVKSLVLLCPGFDLAGRWHAILGPERLRLWETRGTLELPDADGKPTPVWWRFIEDARTHPAWPEVPCPTLILHGRGDEVVPIDSSRAYARTRPRVRLIELDDDHGLVGSLERIADETLAWWT